MQDVRAPQLALVAAAAALFVASLVGFLRDGTDRDDVTSSSEPGAVTIIDFAFEPPELSAAVGDTVTWTNEDSVAHTVTSDGAGPLASGDLESGGIYEATFDQAGTYDYLCTIHPTMRGTVEVTS